MKWLVALLFIFLFSCHKQAEDTAVRVEIEEIPKEQQIPKSVLLQLDEEFKEEFKATPPIYAFIPLQLAFKEDQAGVLKQPHVEYSFPKGGGQLDLKDVLVDTGSFYMYFSPGQFDPALDLIHMYYISNSPQVEIDGEKFGMGCGKWNDLKGNFKKLQKSDYLKLNTTALRYLHVLAGTYVLIFKQGKNVYLTQVTLTDSRYRSKLCVGDIAS